MRVALFALLLFASQAFAGPKLYVFDCGGINLVDLKLYGLTENESQVREFSVPCYIVEHPEGKLLWEAGLPKRIVESDGPVTLQGSILTYDRWIGDQLADIGLTTADISHVAFSHLHFDHTGAAMFFPKSEVLMQRRELEAALGENYAFADNELLNELKTTDMTFMEGDHDLFGDGSVRLIFAPGHTPGHQVLLVDLDNTGPVVLVGDLYHTKANRALRRPPVFNDDGEQTLDSMDKVEELMVETGATLWIGHDKAQGDQLKKAPAYYD